MSYSFDAAMPPAAEAAAFDTTPAVTTEVVTTAVEAAAPVAAEPVAAPMDMQADVQVAAPAETSGEAPAADSPADPAAALEAAMRLAEAMVFASAEPVTPRALGQLLPDGVDASTVLSVLRERYAGRGVELVDVAGGYQFRTSPDLAPALRKVVVVPRRLPRVAMETLAIIAYHQPVTRPEIEEMRGASLAQQTLDALLEADLIAPKGRKEAPGRPMLWGTTPNFLSQFGLEDLRELPRREDLLVEPAMPAGTPETLGPIMPGTEADARAAAAPELAAELPAELPPEASSAAGEDVAAAASVPVPPESC